MEHRHFSCTSFLLVTLHAVDSAAAGQVVTIYIAGSGRSQSYMHGAAFDQSAAAPPVAATSNKLVPSPAQPAIFQMRYTLVLSRVAAECRMCMHMPLEVACTHAHWCPRGHSDQGKHVRLQTFMLMTSS